MSKDQLAFRLIGCLLALSFGASAAYASVVPPPSSTYNLIGPQNNLQSAHSNGSPVLQINPPAQTWSNPVNHLDTQTVTGSLTATVTPENGFNSSVKDRVGVGAVSAMVQNGAGFPDGGAYAEARLTQYVRVYALQGLPKGNQVFVNVLADATASIDLKSNPLYTDSFGNTGYWAGQSATAKISIMLGDGNLTEEVQTPFNNAGSVFKGSKEFGPQLTHFTLLPVDTWVPVFEDVIAEDGSSFNGTVTASIDPIVSLDSADATNFGIEISSLDFPSVPEVQPLALICAVCIVGLIFVRRSAFGGASIEHG